MSYAAVRLQVQSIVSNTTPDVDTLRPFVVLSGKTHADNAASNSGGFRRFEVRAGSSQRTAYVNGTAPKQLRQDAQLLITYPETDSRADLDDVAESDLSALRARLEDPENYSFDACGLQNIQVTGNQRQRRTGGLTLSVNLTLTYIGDN